MMRVLFTSRPLIPMASAPTSSAFWIISVMPTLMPRLCTSYPLLVRMMSTRFFPMSWTSPFTVASTIGSATGGVGLLHVWFEVGDRGLHRRRGLQDEGQLHLSGGEEVTDGLHGGEEDVVDDVERLHPGAEGLIEIGAETVHCPVDDGVGEPPFHRPSAAIFHRSPLHLDTAEQFEEHSEGILAFVVPVVDEVEAGLDVLVGDPVERGEPPGVDDGRIETRLEALVEEHRVQDVTGGRRDPERDVGDPRRRIHPGQLLLDATNRSDRWRRRPRAGRRRRW